MFRSRSLTATALALGLALALPSALVAPARAADMVTSVPVSFRVVNENRSAVPCPADGKEYTVTGHLSGPASALRSGTIEAATLYLHGNAVDERLWNYPEKPAYDYAAAMARAGFVSVTVTRLGYPGSGRPNGNEVCFGSEADVAHQIVEQLRAGSYRAKGGAPKVARVALAGHSASGFVAMAAAYSFRNVDALLVVASGEFTTPRVPEAVAGMQARCVGSDDGYELIETDDARAAADFFFDGESEIVEDIVGTRPADACAGTGNAAASIVTDAVMLASIDVPVLVITGAQDAFFADPAMQASLFTGSSDVEAIRLPDTGHAITLERSAPAFRKAMAGWLGDRGFAAR
ncbi:MAG: alpha/beta hydrolase [Sporichthyaceae bacterium]